MKLTANQQDHLDGRKVGLEFLVNEFGLARVADLLCELHRERRHEPNWFKVDPVQAGLQPHLRGIEVVDLDMTIASLRALIEDLERCRDAERKAAALFEATRRV